MLKDLNIWFAKKNNNNMFLAGALLVLWILLNPVMIFAQEQTEVNEGVLEEEFVIEEPAPTEREYSADHNSAYSDKLDAALEDPYFVDLLNQAEAHGEASHLDMWSNHTDEESHSSALSNHGDASHADVWSNHSDDQSHSPDFSNHTDDMSHIDIYSQIDNYLGTP